VAESNIFCEWNPSKNSEWICSEEGKCIKCTEKVKSSPVSDLYPARCHGKLEWPNKLGYSLLRKRHLEDILVKLEDLEHYPAESLSLENATGESGTEKAYQRTKKTRKS